MTGPLENCAVLVLFSHSEKGNSQEKRVERQSEGRSVKNREERYWEAEPMCASQFGPSCAAQEPLGARMLPHWSFPAAAQSLGWNSLSLNNTCVLPQHLMRINIRAKGLCFGLPFDGVSIQIVFGLSGVSGSCKTWDLWSQNGEKRCPNKSKLEILGKALYFNSSAFGKWRNLYCERTKHLDAVLASKCSKNNLWKRCWKAVFYPKGRVFVYRQNFFCRLGKERALSNFPSYLLFPAGSTPALWLLTHAWLPQVILAGWHLPDSLSF